MPSKIEMPDVGYLYYRFGSADSKDVDVLIDYPEATGSENDRQLIMKLVAKYPGIASWNINIIRIESGVVVASVPSKGSPDAVNNSLFDTYLLAFAKSDSKIISIGAIKPKTASDFSNSKSGLSTLSKNFNYEIGYFYTSSSYLRKGIGTNLLNILLKNSKGNLMATTEMRLNNSMIGILTRTGFKRYGEMWKSELSDEIIGLFLRFNDPFSLNEHD